MSIHMYPKASRDNIVIVDMLRSFTKMSVTAKP